MHFEKGPLHYMCRIGRAISARIRRAFVYSHYDSSAYWRSRASEPGQESVLWRNEDYNDLYRAQQKQIIKMYVESLPEGSRVLDIGCGIGIVSEMIIDLNPKVTVDAVDFAEMIDVAQSRVSDDRVNFIRSSAESYCLDMPTYDLVISSACYSAMRDISALERSLDNCCKMIKPDCRVLMIDPFHRWNFLARAKYASRDVIRFVKKHELILEEKSGVLFWPVRELLADSSLSKESLTKGFHLGEAFLRILGRHFWADYKILVFKRKSAL